MALRVDDPTPTKRNRSRRSTVPGHEESAALPIPRSRRFLRHRSDALNEVPPAPLPMSEQFLAWRYR